MMLKRPWIGLLFTLYHCEAVRPSKLLKVNRVHRMDYVDELISEGLAVSMVLVRRKRRRGVSAIRYVAISDKGRRLLSRAIGLAKAHRLDRYIRYRVVSGLAVLEDESKDLLYALAKISERSEVAESGLASGGGRAGIRAVTK